MIALNRQTKFLIKKTQKNIYSVTKIYYNFLTTMSQKYANHNNLNSQPATLGANCHFKNILHKRVREIIEKYWQKVYWTKKNSLNPNKIN